MPFKASGVNLNQGKSLYVCVWGERALDYKDLEQTHSDRDSRCVVHLLAESALFVQSLVSSRLRPKLPKFVLIPATAHIIQWLCARPGNDIPQ